MSHLSYRATRANRRGLSFFEFIGCLMALVGGVVGGSMYLGIDVPRMAIRILHENNLIEAAPVETEQSTTANMNAEAQATPPGSYEGLLNATASENDLDASTEQPLSTTKSWQESLQASLQASVNEAIQSQITVEYSEQEQRQRTATYWNQINAALTEQRVVEARIGQAQLFDALSLRKQGHEAAYKAMRELDSDGVRDQVASYSARLKQWHVSGIELYGQALSLLTASGSSTLTGPMAQSWQSAATQHRMEKALLREKHLSIAGFLRHWLRSDLPAEETQANNKGSL